MGSAREYETSIEVLRGEGDDAEYVEVDVTLHFTPHGAEPDVGIMGNWADDVYFTMPDGSDLPADVAAAIDAKFEERELERALEALDDDYDYPEWD